MSEFGVNINSTAAAYVNTYSGTTKADSKAEEKKEQDKANSTGAVYEKDSSDKPSKATQNKQTAKGVHGYNHEEYS